MTGKSTARFLLCAAALALAAAACASPWDHEPRKVDLTGIIPASEREVSGMAHLPDGCLVVSTRGRGGHLLVFDPESRAVTHLGGAPEGAPIAALAAAPDGTLYFGTATGHIYALKPPFEPQAAHDLGVPVAGEGICALAFDAVRRVLYGITTPNGHLFKHGLSDGQSADLGIIAGKIPHEERRRIPTALILDPQGRVFTSGEGGRIICYDPETDTIEKTQALLPAVRGRGPWQAVEVLVRSPGGAIYGGDSDGYLFRFDPASETLANLGKPIRQHHIQALAFGPDGRLYGVGGEPEGMARAFAYDPERGYELFGIPTFEGVGAMAFDDAGNLVVGERGRLAALLVFPAVAPAEEASP